MEYQGPVQSPPRTNPTWGREGRLASNVVMIQIVLIRDTSILHTGALNNKPGSLSRNTCHRQTFNMVPKRHQGQHSRVRWVPYTPNKPLDILRCLACRKTSHILNTPCLQYVPENLKKLYEY
jgi:hypothetical protein